MKTFLLIHGSWHGAWSWHKIFPDRIEHTIDLASFMLPDGKRILDYVPHKDSKLTGHVDINRLALWAWLDPVDRVESIKSSHSAYFSMPDELTGTSSKLAGAE